MFRQRAEQANWRPTLKFLFARRVAEPGWRAGVQLLEKMLAGINVGSLRQSPVTNSQFARFAAAGGYVNQSLWHDDGWKWREEESRETNLCDLCVSATHSVLLIVTPRSRLCYNSFPKFGVIRH